MNIPIFSQQIFRVSLIVTYCVCKLHNLWLNPFRFWFKNTGTFDLASSRDKHDVQSGLLAEAENYRRDRARSNNCKYS